MAAVAAPKKLPDDLKAPTDNLTAALKDYDAKQQTYAQRLSKLNDAIEATQDKGAKTPDPVTSAGTDASEGLKTVKADYSKATASVTALAKLTDPGKLKGAQSDLSSSLSDYKAAVAKYQDAENSLGTALTAWNSLSNNGKKPPEKSAPDTGGSSGPSDTVANDVALIVQTIVWQSFVTEQCQRALFQNYSATASEVRGFCLDHMNRADAVRAFQLTHILPVSTSTEAPTPAHQKWCPSDLCRRSPCTASRTTSSLKQRSANSSIRRSRI